MADTFTKLAQILAIHNILSSEELDEFLASLSAGSRPAGAKSLLQMLVRGQKLTRYQAQQIVKGKAKELVLGNYLVLNFQRMLAKSPQERFQTASEVVRELTGCLPLCATEAAERITPGARVTHGSTGLNSNTAR
jgi:hypothetical protein